MEEIAKELLGKISFWVCLTVCIILILAGFFAPPMGVIDRSVLTAVGEIFGFATLAVVADAIKEGYDAKIRKGDIEININNNE